MKEKVLEILKNETKAKSVMEINTQLGLNSVEEIQELERNLEEFQFNPETIDFVLLTHAHIDHSGRIPKLYKEGFRNKVYAHKATCDLCSLMLPDSRTYSRNGNILEK